MNNYLAQGYLILFMLNSDEHEIDPTHKVKFLTFVNGIDTASESFKARNIVIFQHSSFMIRINSCSAEFAQLS